MEKSFEKFCARAKRNREGVPVQSKYADCIAAESLGWASDRSATEVAEGLGISKGTISRWRRLSESVVVTLAADEGTGVPPVLNVTRISVMPEGLQGNVLARVVRGAIAVEFLDEGALVRFLQGVLA